MVPTTTDPLQPQENSPHAGEVAGRPWQIIRLGARCLTSDAAPKGSGGLRHSSWTLHGIEMSEAVARKAHAKSASLAGDGESIHAMFRRGSSR